MNVRFIARDARQRAKPDLDAVLSAGTEQIAIACAFLTPGGVELLKRHADRLLQEQSFVVVSWDRPTSLDALNELHAAIPGKVWVHLGSLTPVERGVGPGLMHSKVFFARAGRRCSLWTGSHNLTASATQGVNCEAAVLVEGTSDESVFDDALMHLNQCKSEATLFDPFNPPPPRSPEQTLVIHAECHVSLAAPPWFVHLRPDTTQYDSAMRPPAAVWLNLYEPGSLLIGRPRPAAIAAFSGTLTGLSFTDRHPRYHGISADWPAADYVIDIDRSIPRLTEPKARPGIPSQGVFRVEATQAADTVWLTETPVPRLERVVGVRRVSDVDAEFRRFFTKQSLQGTRLLHQEYRSMKSVLRVARKELGGVEGEDLQARLGVSAATELLTDEALPHDDTFAFIYRARYRA